MKRREFLAGIIPLSITAAVAPGVLIAAKPDRRSRWKFDRDARCGHGEFRDRFHYLQWLRDQGAAVCPTCDVPHDPAHVQGGRGCYTPDLIARIEQLRQEFGKLNDEVQQLAHRNDDLQAEIRSRSEIDRRTVRTWNARLDWLRECKALSTSKGNADVNDYGLGFANGLILAESIMDGTSWTTIADFLERGEHR